MSAALVCKPHPVDAALAALAELTSEALSSGRSSRFAEVQRVAQVALQVQRLRAPESVAEAGETQYGGWGHVNVQPVAPVAFGGVVGGRADVDLNREIVILAQSFVAQQAAPRAVSELADLMALRTRLQKNSEEVPAAIASRIDHLLHRIGDPHVDPEPPRDSLVPAEPVRGHPPEEPDRGSGDPGGVGEALSE